MRQDKVQGLGKICHTQEQNLQYVYATNYTTKHCKHAEITKKILRIICHLNNTSSLSVLCRYPELCYSDNPLSLTALALCYLAFNYAILSL